jgi:RNA polymerase sigma-70 factor (ECF subfamily)
MNTDYRNLPDSELGPLIKYDHKAFEEIYKRYWAVLYSHAKRLIKNSQTAEDIVQNLFVKLLSDVIEYKQSSIWSYLYTSLRNEVIDVIRHDKVKLAYVADKHAIVGNYITDDTVRENELKMQIEREIANLPEKMRDIFELSRKKFYTHKEIADEVGVSEGTVKKQIYYAITRLRSKLSCLFFWSVMNIILMIYR